MTNSNDTSTPAMSAETVPSEEFVLVPREPTPAMVDAGTKAGIAATPWCPAAYRAMIAAAPQRSSAATEAGDAVREAVTEVLGSELNCAYDCTRVWEAWSVGTMSQNDFQPVNDRLGEIVEAVLATLSASHLAKEGGEAGAVGSKNKRIAELEAQLAAMEARKDGAYEERNRVVAALAKVFPSGTCRTDIPGWSDDWHGCVRIDLPTGQVSWHFHDTHAHLFAGLPAYSGEWDGHDTPEKYRRLASIPQPSPALAKGGDAVREAMEECAKIADHEAEMWGHDVGSSARVAAARIRRAALSTPTEGPASAEDWLRGMARMSSYPVEICQKFEDLADLIMERHNATA